MLVSLTLIHYYMNHFLHPSLSVSSHSKSEKTYFYYPAPMYLILECWYTCILVSELLTHARWEITINYIQLLCAVFFHQSVQSLSCVWLCDPMDCSMPGFPVHHQLPELTQTHIHRVAYAIQPSHLLLSSSPPAPNPSQHQSLFQWVNSSHEVAKVLEFQL